MAASIGVISGRGSSSSWFGLKGKNEKMGTDRVMVCCASASASAVADPYKTLRIQPGASESEVKKAFRQLALQYHPDVCRGSNCGLQFSGINEAYDVVMNAVRGGSRAAEASELFDQGNDEAMSGANDPEGDMWEEWMGWEGAGIRDYSSHINPYI